MRAPASGPSPRRAGWAATRAARRHGQRVATFGQSPVPLMPRRFVLLVCLAAVGAGCSGPPTSAPGRAELAYLVEAPPAAALDSVAAWAAESDFLRVDRLADGLVLSDRRPGERNVATVGVRPRADGLTEVAVASEYVVTPAFRDLGVALYLGQKGEANAAYALPRPDSPTCFPLADWREAAPDPEAAAVELVSPELIGGLRGVQERLVYPETLRRANVMGVALVEFVVGEAGAVECAQVVSSAHPAFSEAARAAVLASSFTPGTRGGEPASFRFAIPLTFVIR